VVREPTAIWQEKNPPLFRRKKNRGEIEGNALQRLVLLLFSFLPQRRRIKSKRGNEKIEKR
jgi:hypothetical protein